MNLMIYPDSERLWTLLFTNTPEPEDVLRWTSQKFVFSESIPVVLQQVHGGPCGVLAPVQAFIVKELLFGVGTVVSSPDTLKTVSPADMQDILLGVLIGIMSKALLTVDAPLLFVRLVADRKFEIVKDFTIAEMTVLDYLASVVVSRGIETVQADMDDIENPFIGRFGHCSQEVLNLMLFGRATSNVFDLEQPMGDTGLILRGVPADVPIEVGLLSELEALRYVTVGSKFKHPVYPIWIIGTTTHYTVLFGFDPTATELEAVDPVRALVSSRMAPLQFDDGLMMADRLEELVSSLGLSDHVASARATVVQEGIVLLDDVIRWAGPILISDPSFMTPQTRKPAERLDLFLINTQIPQELFRVSVSKTGVESPTDLGGNLGAILKTRWPRAIVSVTPF